MKFETSDKKITKAPGRYDRAIQELIKGKSIINLKRTDYQGIRMAFYRKELKDKYRMHTLKQKDGLYSIGFAPNTK
jgi:hypothetical protein